MEMFNIDINLIRISRICLYVSQKKKQYRWVTPSPPLHHSLQKTAPWLVTSGRQVCLMQLTMSIFCPQLLDSMTYQHRLAIKLLKLTELLTSPSNRRAVSVLAFPKCCFTSKHTASEEQRKPHGTVGFNIFAYELKSVLSNRRNLFMTNETINKT